MRRVFLVLELSDSSGFDIDSDVDLDELAEDGLTLIHGVVTSAVYPSLEDLIREES